MKYIKTLLIAVVLMCLFIPLNGINGADTYGVYSVNTSGTKTLLTNYDNYNDALNKMNSYNSNMNDVAVITRNGKIVNAMYGLFRFNRLDDTITFRSIYGDRYIHPNYSSDAVVIGYIPSSNEVMIKMSGVVGYVNANLGNVQPVSYLTTGDSLSYDPSKLYLRIITKGGLRLRSGSGKNYKQYGCPGEDISCDTSAGGIFADEGAVYEWLNNGKVISADNLDWYQVNVKGNIGYIANDPKDAYVELVNPVSGNRKEIQTYYTVSGGSLVHSYYALNGTNTQSSINLGKAPLYLKEGARYYSFDGIFFYETFTQMVRDYQKGVYTNAINRFPYYNYYQYMPSRSQTIYNADNINAYLNKWYSGKINRDDYYERFLDPKTGKYAWRVTWNWDNFAPGLSMLCGEGASFINSQNKYGVNALQTFALSVNESAWGRSYISVRQYNIFGHNAVDSNPDAYATGYNTVADGIMAHANKYIAQNYDNPISGLNYYGGHYGNKLSGNNVSYASDAYWGEKMASQYASFDRNYGYQEFNNKINIGIKITDAPAKVYKDPNSKSTSYYTIKGIPDIPVNILDTVKGENINGNDVWYKIQSDVPIDVNRNVLDVKTNDYNFDTSYAYVHSSYIYMESKAPIIYASDISMKVNTTFEPLKNVSAYDPWDGTVSIKLVSNNVKTSIVGNYKVVYEATDSEGNKATKEINVSVLENSNPTIHASNQTILLNSVFDPKAGVTASDLEDGNITSKIIVKENNVNTKVEGKYKVVYQVTDSSSYTTTKEIYIEVKNIILELKTGRFDLEYFKNINNKLSIKGFSTIDGFDNNISNNLQYKIVFENLDNQNLTYEQTLNRITNYSDIPYKTPSADGKDYTYSWFEGSIDIDKLPVGNYRMYIVTSNMTYYSKNYVSNQLFGEQVTQYNTSSKYLTTRNNYFDKNKTLEIMIRDKHLGNKTTNPLSNQFGQFEEFRFLKNAELYLYGNSFSTGMSLNNTTTRKIIFENKKTFQTYEFNLGATNQALYQVKLPVNDNLSKEYAWYKNTIDLDAFNLSAGEYVIYIATNSNLNDFGELNEQMFRDLESVKATYNGKSYSFKVNYDQRYRVELIVK